MIKKQYQNRQKSIYIDKNTLVNIKLNKKKKQENIFKKNKKIVTENLEHKKTTLYKRYKLNGKKRKKIHMT